MGQVREQRTDLEAQREALLQYVDEHGIAVQAVRGSWTAQEQQLENSTVEQALSQRALYARTVVQQALDTDAAVVPAALVYRQKGGAPRPPRVVGCILLPETVSGKAELERTAVRLQAELGLEQPWRMSDGQCRAAFAEWRTAEILAVQVLVEKLQVMHRVRPKQLAGGQRLQTTCQVI